MSQLNHERKITIIARGDLEINMESIVNVPRKFVYQAHVDPTLIPKWWGPQKYVTTVVEMDVRPGGKWRYIQRDNKGNKHVFFGEYKEIGPLEKITWTFCYEPYPDISIETVEFIELNEKQTKIIGRSIYPSKEVRDAVLQSGMESGYKESIIRLEKIDF